MALAIYLYGKHEVGAKKIDDKVIDGFLAKEAIAPNLAGFELIP